jgi:hypothetical protein
VPSASEHEEQAASNREFYGELGGENAERSDWAVTVLFYCAVQEVQALILRKGWRVEDAGRSVIPRTHFHRDTAIRENCPQIWNDYSLLKGWSKAARYDCERFDGKLSLAEQTLDRIRAEIDALG